MLNRLADPAVPAINKVSLVQGATPEGADKLDKFTAALRDNGYLPMTSRRITSLVGQDPSNVTATVNVNTSQANNRRFTFPMEFTPSQGGWSFPGKPRKCYWPWAIRPHRDPAPGPAPARPPTDPAPSQGPSPSPRADPMWIGWLEFDVLLGDVRSLKQKRSVIRPVVAELQRKFSVSAAETGSPGTAPTRGHRRGPGVGRPRPCRRLLDAAERWSPRIRSSNCCRCGGPAPQRQTTIQSSRPARLRPSGAGATAPEPTVACRSGTRCARAWSAAAERPGRRRSTRAAASPRTAVRSSTAGPARPPRPATVG